jgi:hypothetical protein
MQASTGRKVGALIALTGFLGIALLGLDRILWESLAGRHAYALIAFVIVDFAVAAYVITKPGKMALTIAALWSAFRVVLQFANLYSANEMGLTYAQFATYLFNPLIVQAGNPPGVPAALLDLIMLLEVIVVLMSWKGRSAAQTG